MTTDTPVTPSEQAHLHEAAERLHREFDEVFSTETVEALLTDSFSRLRETATVQTFLPLLAERFTRERLRAAAKKDADVTTDHPTVLFLCVYNAGRSQMAAGWMQHLAGDRIQVLSGGSSPAGEVNPAAIEAMRQVGIDITRNYPKPWTEETVGAADVIVTMGCGDACPVLPGKRYLDWELEDPAGKGVEQVRPVRDEIERRVRALMTELGVDPSI